MLLRTPQTRLQPLLLSCLLRRLQVPPPTSPPRSVVVLPRPRSRRPLLKPPLPPPRPTASVLPLPRNRPRRRRSPVVLARMLRVCHLLPLRRPQCRLLWLHQALRRQRSEVVLLRMLLQHQSPLLLLLPSPRPMPRLKRRGVDPPRHRWLPPRLPLSLRLLLRPLHRSKLRPKSEADRPRTRLLPFPAPHLFRLLPHRLPRMRRPPRRGAVLPRPRSRLPLPPRLRTHPLHLTRPT